MNILKFIKEKDTIDLTRGLVSFPSYTEHETECARFLAEWMKERGFETELQEVEEGRWQVIGRVKGSGDGQSIMYNGHLDVDGVHLKQQREPWELTMENGRLYGHGIWNMKAGVTAMVIAADAVLQSGVELLGDIVIAGVVGELQGGVGTVHLLKEGVTADMAVVTEPTSLNLMTMHAGILELMISTIGVSKHIMRKEESVDALSKMIKIIKALESMEFTYEPVPELPGLPRILVGAIRGGLGKDFKPYAYNSPDYCTILTDTRIPPTMTVESTLNDIMSVLEGLREEDPELNYEIRLPPLTWNADKVIMPPHTLPHDELIVQTIKKNHEIITGIPVKKIGALTDFPYAMSYTGDDDAHLYNAGIPAFCYGPGYPSKVGEPPDQYVELDEIMTCAKVLAKTAFDICKEPRGEPPTHNSNNYI